MTLSAQELSRDMVKLALVEEELTGLAQISRAEDECYIEKLFVDPPHMGKGVGRVLFEWSRSVARQLGATQMIVEAAPGAVPFYLAMHCKAAGIAPSDSIQGQSLPRLLCDV